MATEIPAEGTPASAPDPAAEKAAYDEGLKKLLAGETTEEPPAEEVPPKPEGEAEDEPEAEADDDHVEDEETADEEEEDGDPKIAEEALRKLQKEKRTFEKHKSEVLAHERTVKEREQRVDKGERELTGFISELKASPVETLLKNDMIPEADFQFWARQFHLLSPEGLKDPRSRPEAERLRRERSQNSESRVALARVEKLEQERVAEKAQLQADRELNDYVTRIDSSMAAYKAKTPLLAKAMEKDASATKRELYLVASELAKANHDQFVEPGKVFLAWEKQQRERIARLGLSVPATTPAVPAKAKPTTAAKPQGQVKPTKGAPAAKEPADDDPPLEGDAYFAELRRRLKQ